MAKRSFIYTNSILLLLVVIIGLTNTAMAYTYTADDNTDYDYAYYHGGWWGFDSVSVYTSNGQMKFNGGWTGGTVQTLTMRMALEFVPSTTGRVHCSADMSLSYKLKAGTAVGAYSYLYIRLVLLDSSKNPLESDQIWFEGAYNPIVNQYYEKTGTPWISEDVYWSYSLQQGTTYYAAVEMYSVLFNGGWAQSAAGGVLCCDVSEISVYT